MKNVSESPPDIAIALKYDGTGAPRVTAKGRDEVAQQILALAKEHDVPLQSNEGLVQLLSRVPLGDEVPENLYRAVAEVIAFAFFISGHIPPGYEVSPAEPHQGPRD